MAEGPIIWQGRGDGEHILEKLWNICHVHIRFWPLAAEHLRKDLTCPKICTWMRSWPSRNYVPPCEWTALVFVLSQMPNFGSCAELLSIYYHLCDSTHLPSKLFPQLFQDPSVGSLARASKEQEESAGGLLSQSLHWSRWSTGFVQDVSWLQMGKQK